MAAPTGLEAEGATEEGAPKVTALCYQWYLLAAIHAHCDLSSTDAYYIRHLKPLFQSLKVEAGAISRALPLTVSTLLLSSMP